MAATTFTFKVATANVADGTSADIWQDGRFLRKPRTNDLPPAGAADASGTTTSGAVTLTTTVVTNYWVRVFAPVGQTTWIYVPSGNLGGSFTYTVLGGVGPNLVQQRKPVLPADLSPTLVTPGVSKLYARADHGHNASGVPGAGGLLTYQVPSGFSYHTFPLFVMNQVTTFNSSSEPVIGTRIDLPSGVTITKIGYRESNPSGGHWDSLWMGIGTLSWSPGAQITIVAQSNTLSNVTVTTGEYSIPLTTSYVTTGGILYLLQWGTWSTGATPRPVAVPAGAWENGGSTISSNQFAPSVVSAGSSTLPTSPFAVSFEALVMYFLV